jgi:methylenetetrahydrofolate dehydrogenase (NADP+)/methenyltetrahydrofolate cyclohydrolase
MDYQIPVEGAQVVVLGRSMIVGKPLALLLMAKGPGGNATVTVANSRSRELPALCRSAPSGARFWRQHREISTISGS